MKSKQKLKIIQNFKKFSYKKKVVISLGITFLTTIVLWTILNLIVTGTILLLKNKENFEELFLANSLSILIISISIIWIIWNIIWIIKISFDKKQRNIFDKT